jgi:hypothetical protein
VRHGVVCTRLPPPSQVALSSIRVLRPREQSQRPFSFTLRRLARSPQRSGRLPLLPFPGPVPRP